MARFHRTHHERTPRDDAEAGGEHVDREAAIDHDHHAHDRFGGTNWGAAFFGWLTAIAIAVLLTGILGALASAIGVSAGWTATEAESRADEIGLGGAIALALVLLIAYYAGGYVAGRMSRFDGARQGMAVWLIGLIVTLIAAALGAIFGREYNVLERVDMPTALPPEMAAWGGLITFVVIVLVTLGGALAGGKLGQRYHSRVDRARDHH